MSWPGSRGFDYAVDDDKMAKDSFSNGSRSPPLYGESEHHQASLGRRFIDSFKRDPAAHATPRGTVGANGKVFDVESAAAATADSPLARRLKGRHLQMIAIGGSIGTSDGYLRVACDRMC